MLPYFNRNSNSSEWCLGLTKGCGLCRSSSHNTECCLLGRRCIRGRKKSRPEKETLGYWIRKKIAYGHLMEIITEIRLARTKKDIPRSPEPQLCCNKCHVYWVWFHRGTYFPSLLPTPKQLLRLPGPRENTTFLLQQNRSVKAKGDVHRVWPGRPPHPQVHPRVLIPWRELPAAKQHFPLDNLHQAAFTGSVEATGEKAKGDVHRVWPRRPPHPRVLIPWRELSSTSP